jgi:hypothetical protein
VIIYGFEEPHVELAAAIITRAVRDARSGRTCMVSGEPCGENNQAGVHVCAEDAQHFLRSEYAALMMAVLGLNRAAVLRAIGV